MPIKMGGPIIEKHMAYYITDDNTSKGKDPNINIISSIHKIKGKTSVNVLVFNYINKHLTFHKGEYVRHLEPAVMDDNTIHQTETHQTNRVTLKKMMAETVTPYTFNPPCHELSKTVQNELNILLGEYEFQFTKDETSIGTTPLTSMTIDTGTSDPISQKPYTIAIKHYQWVKDKIKKLLAAKFIHSSRSSWSAIIIVVPKSDGGKCLVIDYRTLNKVTRKFTWPMPKVEDIFFQIEGSHLLHNIGPLGRLPPHTIGQAFNTKTAFNSPFGKYKYVKVPFGLAQVPAYFQELILAF